MSGSGLALSLLRASVRGSSSNWVSRQFFGYVILAVFSAYLAACANIRLTDTYNPKIEEGLNSYHQSLVTFIKKMELAAGTPEGRYENKSVRDFYASADGALSNLVVRAQADDPGATCVPSKLLSSAIDRFVEATNSEIGNAAKLNGKHDTGGTAQDAEVTKQDTDVLASGSCTVVILQGLKLNQMLLETIHKDERYLTPPASTIALSNMEDGIRIALINETAKK